MKPDSSIPLKSHSLSEKTRLFNPLNPPFPALLSTSTRPILLVPKSETKFSLSKPLFLGSASLNPLRLPESRTIHAVTLELRAPEIELRAAETIKSPPSSDPNHPPPPPPLKLQSDLDLETPI
ncbi:hypothetical protein PanWU01x14_265950 [Parasponia andersonii]|uniref:Uncharacterized protein n=1 Tax=Parasponia andersonii TaxID=3476 RepID=A0A2P5B6T1_PARAD|nr:hypothetical protein PanWU01x14_265950 [Parasponia andersonii]